jgi:hypothetical protein
VFARGANDPLWHKWFDGAHGWLPKGDWEPL